MPLQTIDPKRAVEIISPSHGSGYQIGGRLVLTAKHLFTDGTDSSCRIRSKLASWEHDASVVWTAFDADIALVELPETVENYAPVSFGRFPAEPKATIVNFDLYGWPQWGQTTRSGERPKSGGRHIIGSIYLSDTSPEEGLLVIEPSRGPEAPLADATTSKWVGLSGAAVVCSGLVVAVQHHHQNPQRAASLEATLVSQVSDDPGWRNFLEQHGVSPELEDVIQLQEERLEDDRTRVVEIIEAKLKKLEELDDQLLQDVAQEIAQLPGEGDSGINPNDVKNRTSQTAKCIVNRSPVTDVVGCLVGLMENVEQAASEKLTCIVDIVDHLLPVNYRNPK